MSKYLLIILAFFIVSCSSTKQTIYSHEKDFFTNEINKSIIDDFYNGDTIGISKNIYLLK